MIKSLFKVIKIVVIWIASVCLIKYILVNCGGAGIAFCITLPIVAFYWFPRQGYDGSGSGVYERRDRTNPLYVKQKMRKLGKTQKRYTFMSEVKGIYYCQLHAVVQIFAWLIYGLVSIIQRDKNYYAVEAVLLIWTFIGFTIYFFVLVYYSILFDSEFKRTLFSKKEWNPFSYIGTRREMAIRIYNEYTNIQKIWERLSLSCENMGYDFKSSYKLEEEENLLFFAKKQKEKDDIFALIYIQELKEEHFEEMNKIFHKFIKDYYGLKNPRKVICFTFLICVNKENKVFSKYVNTVVSQGYGRYRLPIGLSFENDFFYVSCQRSGFGVKYYREMRKKFAMMLKA